MNTLRVEFFGPAAVRLLVVAAVAAVAGSVQSAVINVPNASFESPTTPAGFPALPQVDAWLKSAQPVWFDPAASGGIAWDQLAGVFPNTAPGAANHIDNVLGNQAAYMIALPEVSLSQELGETFQVGQSYNLTLGLLGGGGISEGSRFELSLFYRDAANSPVTVAATPVTFSTAGFPTATHLLDFDVSVPTVQSGDAWAGQEIGVQLLSAFGTGAGYWDVDNVRLVSVPEPGTTGLVVLGVGALLLRFRNRFQG